MALNTQYINSSDDKLIQESHTRATATQEILPIYTQEIKNKQDKYENQVKIATFKLKLKQKINLSTLTLCKSARPTTQHNFMTLIITI